MPRIALLDDPAGALEYLPLARLALDKLPREDLAVIAATVGQRPGRRTTARFSVQSRRHGTKLVEIFGFIFADGSGERMHDRLMHLRAEHRLVLPEPLGYDARVNAVWIEEASGTPLPAALTPDRLSTLLDAAAADLVAIHADTADQLRPQANIANGTDPITHVAGQIASLKASYPALEATLTAIPRDLQRCRETLSSVASVANVPLHGNCHAGQWLVSGDAVTMIDIEPTVLGNPAEDLAHFRVDAAFRGWSPTFEQRVADEFLARYESRAKQSFDPGWLRWHTLLQLIDRAHVQFTSDRGADIPGLMRIMARLQGVHRDLITATLR